jgi:hypothetical protein
MDEFFLDNKYVRVLVLYCIYFGSRNAEDIEQVPYWTFGFRKMLGNYQVA